jgi:hypothetical protein
MHKIASTLVAGDTIVDGSGATATVLPNGLTRSNKHAPGKVSIMAAQPDGRVVTLTVADTTRVQVVR